MSFLRPLLSGALYRGSYSGRFLPLLPVAVVRGRRLSLGSSGGKRFTQKSPISASRRPSFLFSSLRIDSRAVWCVRILFPVMLARGRLQTGASTPHHRLDPTALDNLHPVSAAVTFSLRFSHRQQLSSSPSLPSTIVGTNLVPALIFILPESFRHPPPMMDAGLALSMWAKPKNLQVDCCSPQRPNVVCFTMGLARENSPSDCSRSHPATNPTVKGLLSTVVYRAYVTSFSLEEITLPLSLISERHVHNSGTVVKNSGYAVKFFGYSVNHSGYAVKQSLPVNLHRRIQPRICCQSFLKVSMKIYLF